MKDRIEQLERIIPKVKANRKILPKAIECMEWELRALKAEQQVKKGFVKSFSAEQVVTHLLQCETLDDAIMYFNEIK